MAGGLFATRRARMEIFAFLFLTAVLMPLTTTINPALQQNVLQKGTAGGSTGPTKPTLPIAGGQRQ